MRSITHDIRHFLIDRQTLRRWLPAAALVIVMGSGGEPVQTSAGTIPVVTV